jgi:hypothetical protein
VSELIGVTDGQREPVRHRLDTERWIVIGRFDSKGLAQESAKAFVAADHGADEDFRVRRSKGTSD